LKFETGRQNITHIFLSRQAAESKRQVSKFFPLIPSSFLYNPTRELAGTSTAGEQLKNP